MASLLDMGADVNWTAPDGLLYFFFFFFSKFKVYNYLQGDGDTALLAACRNGHRTCAQMLIALGSDTAAASGLNAYNLSSNKFLSLHCQIHVILVNKINETI